ncbi:MAG TPA: methionine aminotransferase [Flavitalea sp.]|nr:methionine aminotransferase [Flavitalea sp.]
MKPYLQSKLPDVGTTIFTVMSVLANQHKAVNLGQGFPDYDMPQELVELVSRAMRDGNNQYVHMNGYIPLREALAGKVQLLYSSIVDPESQITITPGGTYAIYTAITAIIQPGDEVILFEPAYDSYIPNVVINGGIPVLMDLPFPDYSIDWEKVKAKITERTRMIIINSPHNPTGAVLRKKDLMALQDLVRNTNIIVVSDEVYEHLIFDNIDHESILRYPDLIERSFVCFSFGKVYHCTGWKLGYCISSPELMKEFRKVHQFNCFSCNSPAQVGLTSYVSKKESYVGLPTFMQQKRDAFATLMSSTRFTPLPSYGSYFQLYRYDRISDESDKDFSIRITKEFGVATIPVSVFYKSGKDDRVVRFCFAKKVETLEAAAERLVKV